MPFGVRAKIAQDLLDRAGLIATQVHKIVPTAEDPIMRFFEGALSDPSNWMSSPQPDPTPAIESYATSSHYRHDVEPEESDVRWDSGVATGNRRKKAICMPRSPRKLTAR